MTPSFSFLTRACDSSVRCMQWDIGKKRTGRRHAGPMAEGWGALPIAGSPTIRPSVELGTAGRLPWVCRRRIESRALFAPV